MGTPISSEPPGLHGMCSPSSFVDSARLSRCILQMQGVDCGGAGFLKSGQALCFFVTPSSFVPPATRDLPRPWKKDRG